MNNKYWLDLELREDIDDYLTLVYALEQGFDVEVVSIHNPSINELKLLANTLERFNANTSIVLSGDITDYKPEKDIHNSLVKHITHTEIPTATPLIQYIHERAEKHSPTVFCGGSLYTLAKLVQCLPECHWEACIQGGYAGPSLVGEENTLKKFKGREKVPTWNLNLDLASTKVVMTAENLSAKFVSKNICHDAWVHKIEINNNESVFNQTLSDYFQGNKWDNKCMHDLLAFMSLSESSLVSFTPVQLEHTEDGCPKWFSLAAPKSNKQISIAFDKMRFNSLIQGYQPQKRPLSVKPLIDKALVETSSVSRKR